MPSKYIYAHQQIISLAKGHLFKHFIKVANKVGRLWQYCRLKL